MTIYINWTLDLFVNRGFPVSSSSFPDWSRVKCKINDGFLSKGNVVIIRLPKDIFGPGSVIESGLSQRRNDHNYHHAVVLNATMFLENMHLVLLPMPSYSSMDQSKKSSTNQWLLTQPDEFQQLYISPSHMRRMSNRIILHSQHQEILVIPST